MNEVIKKLKSGELTTGNDVCEFLDRSTEWIDDTSEEMRVEENDGYSTMDIMETIKPFGKTVNLNKILTFKNRWVEIPYLCRI
jgi:hypothetical protein